MFLGYTYNSNQYSVFNVKIFKMLRARKRQAAVLRVVAALSKQRKKRKCWIRPWLGRRNALGAYNTLLQELHIRLLLTTMAFSTKNLLKSCWKIELRNIAARHVFFLKSFYTWQDFYCAIFPAILFNDLAQYFTHR